MEIYVGKIVNTHGLKGEVRILSDFLFKKETFFKNQKIIINQKEYEINTYRPHKQYDMITIKGFNDINEVLFLKGQKVYINRENLNINGVLKEDIINFTVIDNNKKIGNVTDLINNHQQILEIDNKHLIPFVDEFIKEVSIENKTIKVELIEGLIDED